MRNDNYIYDLDGDLWYCYYKEFINLLVQPSGFGSTQEDALKDLLRKELK